MLLKKRADFTRCLSEKLLSYALGRQLERFDRCAVDKIILALEKEEYRFSVLATEIVLSDPFRRRRGEDSQQNDPPTQSSHRAPRPGLLSRIAAAGGDDPRPHRRSRQTPAAAGFYLFFRMARLCRPGTPKGEGRDFELSPTLAPLAKVKSQITVIGGLAQDNGRAKGDSPGAHARSAASFLTGAHPVKTAGANIHCGMSVNKTAAAQIGSATRLPSLELGTERGRDAGGCDSGYACTYSNTISWKSPTTR